MPFKLDDAEYLYLKLNDYSFKQPTLDLNQPRPADEYLKQYRLQLLDKKAPVITYGEENNTVRVFHEAFKCTPDTEREEILSRAIDTTRAAVELFKYLPEKWVGEDSYRKVTVNINEPESSDALNKKLLKALECFEKRIAKKTTDEALEELAQLNTVIITLVQQHMNLNKAQAEQALDFMRNTLYTLDIATSDYCYFEKKDNLLMLHYISPASFPNVAQSEIGTIKFDDWDTNQGWYTNLVKKITNGKDNWFEKFYNDNLDRLKSRSFQPSHRFLPNPVNATDETTVFFTKEGRVESIGASTSMGTTEPYDVKDQTSRESLMVHSHLKLLSAERLQTQWNLFHTHWGMIETSEKPLNQFVVFHHTLFADSVLLSSDKSKTKDSGGAVAAKLKANQQVQKFLQANCLVRDKNTKQLSWQSTQIPLDSNQVKINLSLLQANHCVNVAAAASRVRNHDVEDVRQLLSHAVVLYQGYLELVDVTHPDRQKLDKVIKFLNTSNYSPLTSHKLRPEEVKNSLKTITDALLSEASGLPGSREARLNLALSLNAAVEVKCVVHESSGRAALRHLENYSLEHIEPVPVIGGILDYLVRRTCTMLLFIGGMVTAPVSYFRKTKAWSERETIHAAAMTELLAETVGQHQGGCMSALDRKGEIKEQVIGLRKQFMNERTLTGFNETTQSKNKFIKQYGISGIRHFRALMNTGSSVTIDAETKGLSELNNLVSQYEGKAVRESSRKLHSLRKGGGYLGKPLDYDQYIGKEHQQEKRGLSGYFTQVFKPSVREVDLPEYHPEAQNNVSTLFGPQG